jgi:Ras-related protein Rab-23
MEDLEDMEDLEVIMKIIVVGDGRIGKTNLITRFARNKFNQEYKKTLGVDFLQTERFIKNHGQDVQFYIWDTAGQEEYDALTRKYYTGASA